MIVLWILTIQLGQSTKLVQRNSTWGHFESCQGLQAAPARRYSVATQAPSGAAKLSELSDAAQCERGGGTVLWPPDGSPPAKAFCCPWNADWCGGCAAPSADKTKCQRCRGGWSLQDGRCQACLDIPWEDPLGRNCFAVHSKQKTCSKRRFRGLSSSEACCACGGGLRKATEFRYYTEPLLLGDAAGDVKGYPLPRTAERYSVDSSCGLLAQNLTIDGTTGELRLVPGCSTVGCGQPVNEFVVTCTITAHEGSLEASAQMTITGSGFMVWENSVLVVPSGVNHDFPSRSICNGACSLDLACVPLSAPAWLRMQPDSGALLISNDGSAAISATQIPGLTGISGLAGLESSSGSVCSVRNGSVSAAVLALVPDTWSSIKYPYELVSVDLNSTLEPPLEPKDAGQSGVAPMRFSASCSTDAGIRVDFDELTGMGTAEGYLIFHLDIHTGVLQLSPEANVSHLFDRASPNKVRAGIRLQCSILGHFEWQVGVPVQPIKGELGILIQDSTCWIDPGPSEHGWQVVHSMSATAEECRRACRADPNCGVYSTDAGCTFVSPCGPHPVKACTSHKKLVEKVTKCGLGHTCLTLDARESVWRYQGRFCPVALGMEAEEMNPATAKLSWVYKKVNVATSQDIFYLQGALTDPKAKCSAEGLLLTMNNQSWDFQNLTANYIELFGEHVACLQASGGGSPVDLAFQQGKVQLDVSEQTTDVGSGLEMALGSQSCSAPQLVSSENVDEGESGVLEEEVFIDDPTTSTPNDFSLHPCDCFPMSWGANSPVTSESYAEVPAGSNNVYRPELVEIMTGSYMCAQNAFVAAMVLANLAACQQACHLARNCSYFWYGSMAEVQQCRLYNASCDSLVQVQGSSGTFSAMQPWWAVCHRADPETCWAITKRRNYLQAGTGAKLNDVLATRGSCLHQKFQEQCDALQLLGGLGVEKCTPCKYAFWTPFLDHWQDKRRLPTSFRTASRLSISCWAERYVAVTPPDVSGEQSDEYTISCTGKEWRSPLASPGLSGFACGACVQIVAPDYVAYQRQKVQELYFLPNLQFSIYADYALPLRVTKAGSLLADAPPSSSKGSASQRLPRKWQAEVHADASAALWTTEGCLRLAPASKLSLMEGSNASSTSCSTWCATSIVGDCAAEMGETFICSRSSASQCLVAWPGASAPRLQDFRQACPTSFRRALSEVPEDASLLQFLRASADSISCHQVAATLKNSTEAVQAAPEVTPARFSAMPVSSTELGYVRYLQRVFPYFPEECLQFTGAGTLSVGNCDVNSSFTQESLVQALELQKKSQGMDIFGGLEATHLKSVGESFERACYMQVLNNVSLGDPTDDAKDPESMLRGCSLAPVTEYPNYEDAPEGTTYASPVFYITYGASGTGCVFRSDDKFSPMKLQDPCFDGTHLNQNAAFIAVDGPEKDPSAYLNGNLGLAMAFDKYTDKCLFNNRAIRQYETSRMPCNKWKRDSSQVIWDPAFRALKVYHVDGEYCWRVVRTGSGDKDVELKLMKCKDYDTDERIVPMSKKDGSWFSITCPPNTLVNKVNFVVDMNQMRWTCFPATYMGSCYEWITPSIIATLQGMNEARVSCPSDDMGLQEVTLTSSAFVGDSGSLTLRYRCCYTSRMVTSVQLESGATLTATQSRFERQAGVYCPHVRDETGRLRYEQRVSFRSNTATHLGVLEFDSKAGQWCLYWNSKKKPSFGCVDSYIAGPLDGEGLQHEDWAAVPVTDFDGVYVNAGVRQLQHDDQGGRLKWRKLPKPNLVTFEATTAGTAPECKQMVPEWEKVQKNLGKENPCYFVSGEPPDMLELFAEDVYAEHGYASWFAHDGESALPTPDAGFSYEKLLNCFSRTVQRDVKAKQYFKDSAKDAEVADTIMGSADIACAFIPAVDEAPLGFGPEFHPGDVCHAAASQINRIAQGEVAYRAAGLDWALTALDSQDCAGDAGSFARVWCDIHCVKDAVVQGNAALQKSLANAVKVVTENVDLLTKYRAIMLGDKVDLVRAAVERLKPEPVASDPKEMKEILLKTMANIHSLLADHPLDAAGEDAATRAVNCFVSDVQSHFGEVDAPRLNQTSLSEKVLTLLERAETMYHTVKFTTARHGLGRLEAMSRNLGLAARAMQKLARAHSHELGVYNRTSKGSKSRQQALLNSATQRLDASDSDEELSDEGEESHAWQVLMELDSTWWSIRAVLDEYLTDAERYADGISNVAELLHGYRSCSLEYAPVHEGFSQLMKVEALHRRGLQRAWAKAMPLVGLLVSKVVDSDAFSKFTMEDAKSAYATLKLRAAQGLCHTHGEAVAQARAALNRTLAQGFFGQTQRQLATLFKELEMLRGRLPAASEDSVEVFEQSIRRSVVAIQAALPLHHRLTHRWVKRLCKESHAASGPDV